MSDNAGLKIKAIGQKLLSMISGGAGPIEEIKTRIREADKRKRKKAAEAKRRRY